MDDGPLSEWAERRDAKVGRLRAVPIVSGEGPSGSHLNPDAPRAIERWNGHAWEPHTFAQNLAEAKRIPVPRGASGCDTRPRDEPARCRQGQAPEAPSTALIAKATTTP
ncbi:DUF6087 family protein [Streptomyces sp. NBC_01615]|uniref:DUF6087 family protein n=1 Tax=Streptomyces sp. NBC_01615 TaxID=2975898 RepID=UPI003862F74B